MSKSRRWLIWVLLIGAAVVAYLIWQRAESAHEERRMDRCLDALGPVYALAGPNHDLLVCAAWRADDPDGFDGWSDDSYQAMETCVAGMAPPGGTDSLTPVQFCSGRFAEEPDQFVVDFG